MNRKNQQKSLKKNHDNNKIDKEFLIEQYRQCHEHQRESIRQRDVILGFYFTISIIFYGFSKGITEDNSKILLISHLTLIALGFILGFFFTMYRGWHGLFIIQEIIFQEVIHKDISNINVNFIKNIDFNFNTFKSVELLMFLILHTIIASHIVSLFILRKELNDLLLNFLTFGISIIVLGEFLFHFYAMHLLNNKKEKGKLNIRYLWLLQSTIKIV